MFYVTIEKHSSIIDLNARTKFDLHTQGTNIKSVVGFILRLMFQSLVFIMYLLFIYKKSPKKNVYEKKLKLRENQPVFGIEIQHMRMLGINQFIIS